jgi:hypothetical protein
MQMLGSINTPPTPLDQSGVFQKLIGREILFVDLSGKAAG